MVPIEQRLGGDGMFRIRIYHMMWAMDMRFAEQYQAPRDIVIDLTKMFPGKCKEFSQVLEGF